MNCCDDYGNCAQKENCAARMEREGLAKSYTISSLLFLIVVFISIAAFILIVF